MSRTNGLVLCVMIIQGGRTPTMADPPDIPCLYAGAQGPDACETKGACDDWEFRDEYSHITVAHPMLIRLRFVIFANDNDVPVVSSQNLADEIEYLNDSFEDSGIQFATTSTIVYDSPFWDYCGICTCLLDTYGVNMCRVSCIDPEAEPPVTHDEWDMKAAHGVDPDEQINIYVLNFSYGGPGLQYFPWCPLATGVMGGVIIDHRVFGKKCGPMADDNCQIVTHEVGHNLGLWHTFRGVDENGPSCFDCSELAECDGDPGNTDCNDVGDYCADTPAAHIEYDCSPNAGVDCEDTNLPTPNASNFMAYGTVKIESCADNFTPQQSRRMHCWVCDAAPGWIDSPDCNSNDIPDVCELTRGDADDCDANGVPDDCQPDCNNNFVADVCNIAEQISKDCDGNGIPDECHSSAQQRACCHDGDQCTVMTEPCCDELSGVFVGEQTTCLFGPCAMFGL